MYCITDKQVDYILDDIRRNGIEMEDLQLNLMDHICCIIEQQLEEDGDFERFYHATVRQFYKHDLHEIEEETINLLTFKNFYQMKKFMLMSGLFSAVTFITGSFFKIMHWPGASVMLVLAFFAFSLLFLPMVFVLKTKEMNQLRDKWILGLGTIAGILYCASMLFNVMHWPGARIIWLCTLSLSAFVVLPLYFTSGVRRAETRVNTIVTSVLILGFLGVQFTLTAIRPIATRGDIYTYARNELLLDNLSKQASNATVNQLAANVNAACNELKLSLLKEATGDSALRTDDHTLAHLRQQSLQGLFGYGNKLTLLNALKSSVSNYNAAVPAPVQIPVANTILDAPLNQMGAYSNIDALNNIVQVQLFLAINRPATVAMR